jgi:acyl-homoserine lactone acylase PvdQ
MARMIDKGRADIAGTVGEYHFACPLDEMLFGFKGVKADEVKKLLASGATDDQAVAWFNTHGTPKTAEEVKAWSDGIEAYRPYDNPEKKDWFAGECARLGLKPENSTLVEYLDTDDAVTFKK